MSHPDIIASHLDGEEAVATVNLSGEDVLVITPTRSLLYESEGILSDESVSEYPHDVAGVAISDGRRRSTIELTYPIQDPKKIKIPKNRRDTVLHYVLAGIFHAKGITGSGESVTAVYQFNELTFVITNERIITHVGSRVWDDEYEEYPFADLTRLTFEEGNIAAEIVLYLSGRSQRIKVPKGRGEEVKRSVQEAVFGYFDVETLAALNAKIGGEEQDDAGSSPDGLVLDEAVSPLRTDIDSDESDGDDAESDSWPYEPEDVGADQELDVEAIEAIVTDLQDQIEQQRATLDAQEAALEELVDELADD